MGNNNTFVMGEQDTEYTIVIKKKKFPWWILLLLLPLILLIPIKKTIKVHVYEAESNMDLTSTPSALSYIEHGTFGGKTEKNLQQSTNNYGIVSYDNLSQPLWAVLFCNDSAFVSVESTCEKAGGLGNLYNNFKDNYQYELPLIANVMQRTVTVKDKKTGAPLPVATVTIGGNQQTTDENGKLLLTDIPVCASIVATGHKEGYLDSTITMPANTSQMDIPLVKKEEPKKEEPKKEKPKKEEPKKEEPKKEEPKKEEPKKEEPKKEEPKKEEPPKQEDLKGKTGALRINLQWYNTSDLDLAVKDPCDKWLSANKTITYCSNNRGVFDVDANHTIGMRPPYSKQLNMNAKHLTTTPQENCYWETASPGKYVIQVHCFYSREYDKPKEKMKFNITIIDRGERIEIPGTVADQEKVLIEYEVK